MIVLRFTFVLCLCLKYHIEFMAISHNLLLLSLDHLVLFSTECKFVRYFESFHYYKNSRS